MNFLEKLKIYLKSGRLLTKETFFKYIMSVDEELEEEDLKDVLSEFKIKDYNADDLFKDIDKDIHLLKNILEKVNKIKPEDDAKLKVLKDRLLELSKDGQIILFTYYADTLNYIYNEIIKDRRFSKLKIEAISSSGLTSKNPQQREKIVEDLFSKKINILLSTDVLSEGQNLQSAKYLINYDLHWNPTRMIQRAGRIDRIGSPFKKIFVYNFFPEDELEELLKLVEILQNKIIDIDKSVGLDQTILGEEIHPKVFGIIRKIKSKDSKIFAELEQEAFGGGERFYQPLKDFLKNKGVEELEKIPYGVHSGLMKNKMAGIFFYYKYGDDFHFWYLYDVNNNSILTNKTDILEFINCKLKEERVIPNFFEKVYDINKIVVEDIERLYKEIELSYTQDSKLKELSKSKSTKFVKNMINEIEIHIDSYLNEFPNDNSIEKIWESVKNKLISIPQTKKRLQNLRKIWRQYKKDNDWRKMIKELGGFLIEKGVFKKIVVEPFDRSKLKLITIDFIS